MKYYWLIQCYLCLTLFLHSPDFQSFIDVRRVDVKEEPLNTEEQIESFDMSEKALEIKEEFIEVKEGSFEIIEESYEIKVEYNKG